MGACYTASGTISGKSLVHENNLVHETAESKQKAGRVTLRQGRGDPEMVGEEGRLAEFSWQVFCSAPPLFI